MKLNQVLAIERNIKNTAMQVTTKLHHDVQKAELLSGFNKTYRPKNDGEEVFPPESKRVMLRAPEVIDALKENLIKLFDITAVKDATNTLAKANVVVEGKAILQDVPATTLLFLEKQLDDLRTFILKLPVLDPSEEWIWSPGQNLFCTKPTQTTKTKKVEKVVQLAPPTKEHPEQAQIRPEDVTIGYWDTIRYSGALEAAKVKKFVTRVEALREAVKIAREEANGITALTDKKIGSDILKFIFE
jgi:hypothetical protein